MKILTKEEFFVHKQEYLKKILDGAVFIYPTDTIYGIGCDATNETSVAKIRKIKERYDAPFSVIAPNKEWIEENCEVFGKGHDYLKKLPGRLTLIFALKHGECVASNVSPEKGKEFKEHSLGVRISNHWISDIVKELDIPVITTSVNRHGESFLTNISRLPAEIRNKVDFAIDVGEIKGTPSQVIDLVSGEAIVKR
ncbi:Sua5/YciO/YrdC/YwlC family protein [Candidatus Woesearchaeota archaeon]|nr:Sua5/YciO/YrdC/YwlC family protein [Candidatus Woesearchaeota archaeon]